MWKNCDIKDKQGIEIAGGVAQWLGALAFLPEVPRLCSHDPNDSS